MALIDYGLIVIFFVVVAGLVLIMAKPSSITTPARAPLSPATSSSEHKEVAYSFLALLFVLIVLATFFIERDQSHDKLY